METADGVSTHTKCVGLSILAQANDSNQNHVYIILGYAYDPDSPLNTLGVPTLDKFFKDCADPNGMFGS